jgi:predicted metalloprotease with PDZ domain
MRYSLLIFFSLISLNFFGQNDVLKYTLLHVENSDFVKVSIEFDSIHTNASYLQIPRSAPGTYEITEYPNFIEDVTALTLNNERIKGRRGQGSIFFFKEATHISKIEYKVNIVKMENELKGGFASSKLRDQYLGILGYSVFGTIPNLKNQPIELTISSDAQWPIFTTFNPTQQFTNETTITVDNYAMLADAQYLLGNDVQIFNVEDAEIPLIIAVYAEDDINIEEIGRRALLSLQGLSNYFGYVPMPHYTLCYEFLKPYSDEHSYGFSMEHMNSMTASLPIQSTIIDYDPNANINSVIHHMGHSWIPLRSYGKGYRPFDWAAAPIIETIWLNEGFIWYVMSIITNQPDVIHYFERTIKYAPKYIQEKSLNELSQLGSTQYSGDFNIGKNLFSRGALMAKEMDDAIRKATYNKRSFKDALLGLLKWTEKHNRGYNYDEIEPILSTSIETNLSAIWNKWQAPIKSN